MPVFSDHYRNSRQNRDSSSSSPSLYPPPAGSTQVVSVAGGAFASSRPRILPRAYNNRNPKSPHLSNATSPLLSAFQNPSDLFTRSIPFPTFLSGSSPSSGAPGSLGSASGGVGLSGGSSPPPSAPASYSSGGGFSASRQVRGYPGFEEQYSAPSSSSAGGYYPSQRYQHGSPVLTNGQTSGVGAHVNSGEQYACELATLDELGISGGSARLAGGATSGGDNVICLGWDGGVDIWRIGRGAVDQIGRLEGLKGGVKSAKILPNPPLNDPLAAQRPLICLTIHSQIASTTGADTDNGPAILLENDSPYSTSPPSRPETSTSHRGSDLSDWQTSVEVWSLATRTRLATLFKSPPIPTADIGFGNHAPPPVWGGLRVQVTANKIVVAVGTSGELYVFGTDTGPSKSGKSQFTEWKCLEKIWTSVQTSSFSNDSGVGGGIDVKANGFGLPVIGTPVFALSDRWLVYCPASTGSFSAGGEVVVPAVSSSVASQTPPPQPPISAAVSQQDEAFLNRMTREVTQEVIRGAKWAADAGYKKFQSYWNGGAARNDPSPPQGYDAPSPAGTNGYSQGNGSLTSIQPSQPSGLGQQLRQVQMGGSAQQFQYYPTQHAHEPRLVSLVDLHKLSTNGQQNNSPPMATFLPPGGVSYLSFAPDGLKLLTASSKGDLLFVWDLMKVVHHPPGPGPLGHQRSSSVPNLSDPSAGMNSDGLGRHIRQVARFARMTVATIVDVDWSSPRGEKIAVVTERGTAHFYDLPYGALQWPPPKPPPPSSTAINSSQTTAAGAAVTNAVNLFNSSTQPLLTAARRRRSRSSSVGSPNNGIFPSPSGRRPPNSGAPGTSPNDTPTGGDKIPLPRSLTGVTPGCVKFLTAKDRGYVAVLGGNLLRIYELRLGGSGKKGSKTGGVASGDWWEYDLPAMPTASEPNPMSELADGKAAGFWGGRSNLRMTEDDGENENSYWKTPLAYAEIETTSVFVPWHQERRVRMFVYNPPKSTARVTTPDIRIIEPPPMVQEHTLLSPSPLNWDMEEQAISDPPRVETPVTKSKKKSKKSASRSPAPVPLAPPTPEPPTPTASPAPPLSVEPKQEDGDMWVFGGEIVAERIFLSDAGGRGDVEFAGEGETGLKAAMSDPLAFENMVRIKGSGEEGFFEDDAEVLEYTH
ncbi:hypothetical protein EDC01DRAFT_612607 [Geopyxis carbonaria]|nr:hypothetical protein EDC01DRAFT_612607 [Geopyxis carbonaria]